MASILHRLNDKKEVETVLIEADKVPSYLNNGWTADKESLTKPKSRTRKKNENKD